MTKMGKQYTLVQHSGASHNDEFLSAVEPAKVTPVQASKVTQAGGLLFDDYAEAEKAAEFENYRPDNTGMIPRVKGTFDDYLTIKGLAVYIPPTPPGEIALSEARRVLREAIEKLDAAVRLRVSELVREVYPAAAKLKATGEYNEDGLLHLHTDSIVDADGQALGDYDEHQTKEWDALTDQVDALLDEISELDSDYQGEHEIEIS